MKKIGLFLWTLCLCLIIGASSPVNQLWGNFPENGEQAKKVFLIEQPTKKLFHIGSIKKYFKQLLEVVLIISSLTPTRGHLQEQIVRMVKEGVFKTYLEILLEKKNFEQLGLVLETCMKENLIEAFKILITLITYKNGFLIDTVKIGNVDIVRTLIDRFEHDISKHEISKAFDLCYEDEKKKEIAELIVSKFSDILGQEMTEKIKQQFGCLIS